MNEHRPAEIRRINPWPAVWILGKREIVRFMRQRARIVAAVATPLLFWALFGAGFEGSFRLGETSNGSSFRDFYFPGSLVLIVMFTAIFTTISVIEDRREGFLQSVLTAPVARWAIVLGKVWGGAVIALVQASLFLALSLAFRYRFDPFAVLQAAGFLFLAAIALTAVGLSFAWRTDSTQGFHSVMNLVLMPLWLLSGGFFPALVLTDDSTRTQTFMHYAIRCNPLSYAVAGVRRSLFEDATWQGAWMPSLAESWGVTLLFAVIATITAIRICSTRHSGDSAI